MLNLSLSTGYFPNKFKHTTVMLISKPNKPHRPPSITGLFHYLKFQKKFMKNNQLETKNLLVAIIFSQIHNTGFSSLQAQIQQ